MAAKRMDLNKRTFCVLSGATNALGQSLALELCRRFAQGSLVLLLDENKQQLQSLQKKLESELADSDIESSLTSSPVRFVTGVLVKENAAQLLEEALKQDEANANSFDCAIIVHNEDDVATQTLLEPQSPLEWTAYVHRQLYAPVALNQRFLQCPALAGIEKLAVNVTSSLQLRPLIHNSLLCSCKKARDMYFRAMASEEQRAGVNVLNYAPGLFATHVEQYDLNGNLVTLAGLNVNAKLLALPRVQPQQAALKLINILEEISFVSGHDVDYYDTFVL
ncbi:sepiapterin reductase [Scaptodrosophila lebanonensis]|uniref:Sepiapterin reductase n=1 Tax=Drosophila lebanonensis TaxID=7225 RepID=A0A6J2U1K4_DROLE|nr:sepiapterin reductase [Scaptodrosophila lebanonensis]